jgi:hypothetical protein
MLIIRKEVKNVKDRALLLGDIWLESQTHCTELWKLFTLGNKQQRSLLKLFGFFFFF